MPAVKSKNSLKQGTFCNEFNYYLEKLSCMNGNIDYIITREDCNSISDFLVSDFLCDHRALHASMQCIRLHAVRKQI